MQFAQVANSLLALYTGHMQFVAILGRQPRLGVAELERVYGADSVTPIFDSEAALIDADIDAADLRRLGGSVKLAKVLTILDTTNWRDLEKYMAKTLPDHLQYVPEGKFRFGISTFGLNIETNAINMTGLRLKKITKNTGRSVRVVPNKAPALNSAQVLHNQLTTPIGWELILVRQGKKTVLAQTVAEQDIEAYAARDQARPARDAFVGMLPPKLAQIMINLAAPLESSTILDPFCGTGVILQEAALMGYPVRGTDLSDKMIDYSRKNLEWLREKFSVEVAFDLNQADATDTEWPRPYDAVVCETYLGQPFSAPPSPAKLEQVTNNCDHIISEFLKNIASQINPGTPLCVAVPAWRGKDGWHTHLPLIKRLEQLGYRRIEFKNVDVKDLLYFRPDQVVARELLVLEKA